MCWAIENRSVLVEWNSNSTTLRYDISIDQIDMLSGSSGNDWFIFQSGEDKVLGESSLESQYDTDVLP